MEQYARLCCKCQQTENKWTETHVELLSFELSKKPSWSKLRLVARLHSFHDSYRKMNMSDGIKSKSSLLQQPRTKISQEGSSTNNLDRQHKMVPAHAPADITKRRLQKIAQDIQKNDACYLNKFRRLKNKAVPEVPVRDYVDENIVGPEDLSGSEYDNTMYDDLQEPDTNYEPPPSQKVFTRTSSSSFLQEDYLNSCHNRPKLEGKKAFKQGKGSQQAMQMDDNDEDYISPDGSDEEDNYVEPADDPAADFYEVPDQEDNMVGYVSANRVEMRRFPCAAQQADGDSSYELWDHEYNQSAETPRAFLRGSPNSPLRLAQDGKQRDFEQRTLPTGHRGRKAQLPKSLTLDTKRPKTPLPNLTFLKATDNDSLDQDKDAEVKGKPWFDGDCDRKTAEKLLFRANQDGAFMVRKSSRQDANQPYTLVVYYKGRVYNIPIRFTHTRQQYALGTEKQGEEYFRSVSHIIENHQKIPLVLIDSKSNSKDTAKLRFPVTQASTRGHQWPASLVCNAHEMKRADSEDFPRVY
ncbi:B-cell linker protein isoform X1 [Syngnathus typhle]|uniref:B-cell linker protein isoform X1 n=2 Tax=Syngnathus typhle TaxID=161592 RepID=UPI002A69EF53|nr:B-cell linker protein isoform X1 [Syngnathus typhle]